MGFRVDDLGLSSKSRSPVGIQALADGFEPLLSSALRYLLDFLRGSGHGVNSPEGDKPRAHEGDNHFTEGYTSIGLRKFQETLQLTERVARIELRSHSSATSVSRSW